MSGVSLGRQDRLPGVAATQAVSGDLGFTLAELQAAVEAATGRILGNQTPWSLERNPGVA